MNEQIGLTRHEPADSAFPMDALKARIIEMAELGKNPSEPTQNGWRQRETQNGFDITFRTMFVPEAFVTNDEGDLPKEEPNDSNAGLAVLVKNIHNPGTELEPRSEQFISYVIRISEEEGPVLLIGRNSIFNLRTAKDAGIQIGDLEDSLSDFIPEGAILLEYLPIKLTDKHKEFLQKLLNSLNRDSLELIQDDSSSNH